MDLSKDEKEAVKALQALARRWPKSLWLFSASGSLCVMKKFGGQRVMSRNGGVDPDQSIDVVDIENDGGDW